MAINPFLVMAKINGHEQGFIKSLSFIRLLSTKMYIKSIKNCLGGGMSVKTSNKQTLFLTLNYLQGTPGWDITTEDPQFEVKTDQVTHTGRMFSG